MVGDSGAYIATTEAAALVKKKKLGVQVEQAWVLALCYSVYMQMC